MSTVLTPILISSASALILGCAVHMFYFLGGVLVGGGASDVVCDERSARIADGCGSKFNSGVERWCVSGVFLRVMVSWVVLRQ